MKAYHVVGQAPMYTNTFLLISEAGHGVVIDPAACNHFGRCVGKCPFHAADQYVTGYKVYLGVRWCKRSAQGQALAHLFTG